MNLVQTIIPYHANILQMLMWNQWKTLKIPWNFLLLNGCGWTYMILTYVTLLANSFRLTANPPGKPNTLHQTSSTHSKHSWIQCDFDDFCQSVSRLSGSISLPSKWSMMVNAARLLCWRVVMNRTDSQVGMLCTIPSKGGYIPTKWENSDATLTNINDSTITIHSHTHTSSLNIFKLI